MVSSWSFPPVERPLDLLVVAPHPDDAEISMGGTLIVSQREGLSTGVLELTNGEPTPHGSLSVRAAETQRATERLKLSWRGQLDLPNRRMESTLESRRKLAEAFRILRPQIIIVPYWEDAHPDHLAATETAEGARFWAKLSRSDLAGEPFHPSKILYYLSIHLRVVAKPSLIVDVSEVMDEKLAAIRCFESQLPRDSASNPYDWLDSVRDCGRYWGWSIGRPFGEPLFSREMIGVRSLASLV